MAPTTLLAPTAGVARAPLRLAATNVRGCAVPRGALRCRASSEKEKSDAEALGGDPLERIAKEILENDPATRESMAKLQATSDRVQELMKQKAEIDAQYAQMMAETEATNELQEQLAEQAAAEAAAQSNVNSALEAVAAAELELANAEFAQAKWSMQADKEADRAESGKAATAGAVGGALAALPVAATSGLSPLLLAADLGSQLLSAALCGLVYRYAVREDSDDVQLKGGVVGAFGLVRGVALAVSSLKAAEGFDLETIAAAALPAGQSMLVMGFAAIAVEAAMQKGFVKPVSSER